MDKCIKKEEIAISLEHLNAITATRTAVLDQGHTYTYISNSAVDLFNRVISSLANKLTKDKQDLSEFKAKEVKSDLDLDSINRLERRIKITSEAIDVSKYLKGRPFSNGYKITTDHTVNETKLSEIPLSLHIDNKGKALIFTRALLGKSIIQILEESGHIGPVNMRCAVEVLLNNSDLITIPKNYKDLLPPISTHYGIISISTYYGIICRSEQQSIWTYIAKVIKMSSEDLDYQPYFKEIKLGRAITAIMGSAVPSAVVEKIVQEVKDLADSANTNLEKAVSIVEGHDILFYYNRHNNLFLEKLPEGVVESANINAQEKGGSLAGSCMNGYSNYSKLNFYAYNPDRIKLLVLKSKVPNKILARSILWLPDDGKVYMDRIYSISETCARILRKYAKDKGFIGIHHSSVISDTGYDAKFVLEDLYAPNIKHYRLPYLDSLNRRGFVLTKDNKVKVTLSYGPFNTPEKDKWVKRKVEDDEVKYIDESDISNKNSLNVDKDKIATLTKIINTSKTEDLDNEVSFNTDANIKAKKVSSDPNLEGVISDINKILSTRYGVKSPLRSKNMGIKRIFSQYMTLNSVTNRNFFNRINVDEAVNTKTFNNTICSVEIGSKDVIYKDKHLVKNLLLNPDIDFYVTKKNIVTDPNYLNVTQSGPYCIILHKNNIFKVFGKNNIKEVSTNYYKHTA